MDRMGGAQDDGGHGALMSLEEMERSILAEARGAHHVATNRSGSGAGGVGGSDTGPGSLGAGAACSLGLPGSGSGTIGADQPRHAAAPSSARRDDESHSDPLGGLIITGADQPLGGLMVAGSRFGREDDAAPHPAPPLKDHTAPPLMDHAAPPHALLPAGGGGSQSVQGAQGGPVTSQGGPASPVPEAADEEEGSALRRMASAAYAEEHQPRAVACSRRLLFTLVSSHTHSPCYTLVPSHTLPLLNPGPLTHSPLATRSSPRYTLVPFHRGSSHTLPLLYTALFPLHSTRMTYEHW